MPQRLPLFQTAILLFIGGAVSVFLGEVWASIKNMITFEIPIHWLIFGIAYVVALILIGIDRYELRKTTVQAGLYTDLQPLSEFLSEIESQLDAMGTTLGAVSRDNSTIIEELLQKGVHMRFLTLDPNSRFIPDLEKLIESVAIKDAITSSLAFLCNIRKRLPQDKSTNLEIKTYDYLPNTTMIFRDVGKKNGLIRYEPYRSGGSHEHILYIISKRQKKLWQIYTTNFERLWNKGTVYACS